MKVLLLDLDGTIRETISGKKFINDPNDQKAMPGAIEGIHSFANRGWLILGLTNQGGVMAGYKSLDDCIQEQKITLGIFPHMEKILFCPDNGKKLGIVRRDVDVKFLNQEEAEIQSGFRKPSPGMIEYLLKEYSLDLKETWMVGDRPEDEEAASKAKINFCFAEVWRQRFLFDV